MEKSFAKSLFVKYFKKKKLLGTTLLFFFGKPYESLMHEDTNTRVFNKHAEQADYYFEMYRKFQDSFTEKIVKRNLGKMLGETHSTYTMVKFKNDEDKLYEIYLMWDNYVSNLDLREFIFSPKKTYLLTPNFSQYSG